MAIIYQKERKKFSFFFKIGMVFLILGIALHIIGWTFLGELSYFTCCTVILVGIVYVILHHITYFSDQKIERVISILFYVGIASLVLKLFSSMIFKEDYYVNIGFFKGVYDIITFCLNSGAFLFLLSVVIMLVKYRKLFKILKSIF